MKVFLKLWKLLFSIFSSGCVVCAERILRMGRGRGGGYFNAAECCWKKVKTNKETTPRLKETTQGMNLCRMGKRFFFCACVYLHIFTLHTHTRTHTHKKLFLCIGWLLRRSKCAAVIKLPLSFDTVSEQRWKLNLHQCPVLQPRAIQSCLLLIYFCSSAH